MLKNNLNVFSCLSLHSDFQTYLYPRAVYLLPIFFLWKPKTTSAPQKCLGLKQVLWKMQNCYNF